MGARPLAARIHVHNHDAWVLRIRGGLPYIRRGVLRNDVTYTVCVCSGLLFKSFILIIKLVI